MENLLIHKFKLGHRIGLSNIREVQQKNEILIPSDYVYFLLNFNEVTFENDLMLEMDNDEWYFDRFFNLINIVDEVKMARSQLGDYETNFWLENYISIGELTGKRILIGNKSENINKVFIYDNDEDRIDYLCENIFIFINEKLVEVND